MYTASETRYETMAYNRLGTSGLAGASRPGQVLDNIRAAENTHFTEDELKRIDEISL